ncbi:MAG: DUF4055 domain-containing protein [Gemmatimonadetes bacterium]|nr:DUF4055 domain-containing protein [Gemmatimonadota bacterium]
MPRADKDLPSTPSPAVERQQADLTVVRDCWEGNSRLRDKAAEYLPKAPGEDPDSYRVRKLRSVFFNQFRNTIEGLVGYVFRQDPKLGDDVPQEIVSHWENIDNAGTHGDVFARERMSDAMCAGHGAILVEFPPTDGTQTAGQELRGEVRPYWVPVPKDAIVSWRTTVENGRTLLTQLVLRECAEVPEGEFGTTKQERFRVFSRKSTDAGVEVGYRLLEVTKQKAVVEVESGTYPTQDEIPVAEIVTSGKKGLFESMPPFLDLAHLNLAHYRQWSDYDTSIHKTCVPIWVETGVDLMQAPDGTQMPAPIVLGPNAARVFTNPQATAQYQSHSGAALAQCAAALQDLKTAMAELGLAALASSKRAAETATAKEIDKSSSDSALAVNARGLQDGLERALYFHARYLKKPSGGSIEINRDYGEQGMDAQKMVAWATLAEKLGVPPRFVLERLMEAGEIPETTDLDALEGEMLAEQAAREARRQQELAAQQERLMAGNGSGARGQDAGVAA